MGKGKFSTRGAKRVEKSALAVGSEPGFTARPVQGQRQDSKDRPAAHRLYQRTQELGPEGVDAAQQQAGGQAVGRRGEQAGQQIREFIL